MSSDVDPIVGKPEEKSKDQLFAENPERFEDLQACALVIKRDPETGKLFVLNQCESIDETFIIEGRVRESMEMFRLAVRKKAAATPTIVKANGSGFMQGVRSIGRKR